MEHKPDGWVKRVANLARAAGFMHDFGKTLTGFQQRLDVSLKEGRDKLPMHRHELASTVIADNGLNLDEDLLSKIESISVPKGDKAPLHWVVHNHHRRIYAEPDEVFEDESNLKYVFSIPDSKKSERKKLHKLPPAIDKAQQESLNELLNRAQEGLDSFENSEFLAFYLARIPMIWADHIVSSQKMPKGRPPSKRGDKLYANTVKNPQNGRKGFGQTLDKHLREVGHLSRKLSYALYHALPQQLPSVTLAEKERVLEPSHDERFQWQDRGVEALSNVDDPTLCFISAETGSGKTRAAVKIALALRKDNARITSVFNLRVLTHQTYHAYIKDTGLWESSVNMLIGETPVSLKNGHSGSTEKESANRNIFDSILEMLDERRLDLHGHLKEIDDFTKGAFSSMLEAPVLVSTIDYVADATEIYKGAQTHLAFLRLMTSDLIIDEVDSYDIEAQKHILRLVRLCGMLGRNVIIMSATLPDELKMIIADAWKEGMEQHKSLINKDANPQVAYIDNQGVVLGEKSKGGSEESKTETRKNHAPRLGDILHLNPQGGLDDLMEGLTQGIQQLHQNHHITFDNKKVSIGLIRVARIKDAVAIAEELRNTDAGDLDIYATALHGNMFAPVRGYMDLMLSTMLNRKKDVTGITGNEHVREILEKSGKQNISMVIVATPVIEVGCDYDFDWAIIEPSSAHSIVQTAGRVNRHRNRQVSIPNVLIIQYPLDHVIRGRSVQKCYRRPGYNVGQHDLDASLMLPEAPFVISAALMEESRFGKLDRQTIESQLTHYMNSAKQVMCAPYYSGNIRMQTSNQFDIGLDLDRNVLFTKMYNPVERRTNRIYEQDEQFPIKVERKEPSTDRQFIWMPLEELSDSVSGEWRANVTNYGKLAYYGWEGFSLM